MNQINEKTVFNAILRKDFKSFVIKVFKEISPGSEYLDNWHIDVICHELLNVMEGKQTRLIINIPPRYMKSIICSVALPAFILGHNPKASIIVVSYADGLASDIAELCKKVMESSWYNDVFPGTILSKKSTNDLKTTKGGCRYATSVTGTLTGRGGDYIIIDDPIKPEEAKSDLTREKTNAWYGSTLYSRLNNKKEGKIIVIMQRVWEGDFTEHLLNLDPSYRYIKMPAIADTKEKWIVKNRITGDERQFERRKNECLHPEREDWIILQKTKTNLGSYDFESQYQQSPMPMEGGIIKADWIKYYDKDKLFKDIENGKIKIAGIFQSWDTACKTGEDNDYSACVTALRDSVGKVYILESYRVKLEFPNLIKQVILKYENAQQEYNNSIKLLIEDASSGTDLIQELRQNYKIYPLAIKPKPNEDKKVRLIGGSSLIENGNCLFPKDKLHWWTDFEKELLRFPRVKHDDQCDALSQLLYYVKNNSYKPWTPIKHEKIDKTPYYLRGYMDDNGRDMWKGY